MMDRIDGEHQQEVGIWMEDDFRSHQQGNGGFSNVHRTIHVTINNGGWKMIPRHLVK